MLNKLIIVLCLVGSSVYAGDNRPFYQSRNNFYRGQNFYHNGKYIGQTRQNISGGYNYYDGRGRFFMYQNSGHNQSYRIYSRGWW